MLIIGTRLNSAQNHRSHTERTHLNFHPAATDALQFLGIGSSISFPFALSSTYPLLLLLPLFSLLTLLVLFLLAFRKML